MIKAIPMEDWLRGCVYHDGRHGFVTLPTDKVHQIANYIQRTRRSTTDGLIDLEVVEADRKTEPQTGQPCDGCEYSEPYIEYKCTHPSCKYEDEPNSSEKPNSCEDEPQTERGSE